MEDLRDIIAPLKDIDCKSELFYDLVHLVCLDIRDKYIMVAPTKSNLDFIDKVQAFQQSSLPNISVINQVNVDNRQKLVLTDLIIDSLRYYSDRWFERVRDTIIKNCVVIKNDAYLQECRDIIKLTNDLTGTSDEDNIRRIQYLRNNGFYKKPRYLMEYFGKLLHQYNPHIVGVTFLEFKYDYVWFYVDIQQNDVDLEMEVLKEDYKVIKKHINKYKKDFKQILMDHPLFSKNTKKPWSGKARYYARPEIYAKSTLDYGKTSDEVKYSPELQEVREWRSRMDKAGFNLCLPADKNSFPLNAVRYSMSTNCSFDDFKNFIIGSFAKDTIEAGA